MARGRYQSFFHRVSNSVQEAKSWVADKMDTEPVHRCQSFFHPLSSRIQDARSWVANKMETEPALYARSAINGISKATFAVYGVIDFGMMFIPQASIAYNGLKITKYVLTAVTFAGASYSAYSHRKSFIIDRQSLDTTELKHIKQLESDLASITNSESILNSLFKQRKELIQRAGYGHWETNVPSPTLKSEEKDPVVVKSSLENCMESRPIYTLGACIDGMTKTLLIYKLGFQDSITTRILLGMVFFLFSLRHYHNTLAYAEGHEKANLLKARTIPGHEKLRSLRAKLGDQKELVRELEFGVKANRLAIQFIEGKEDQPTYIQKAKQKLIEFKETKKIHWYRCTLDGIMYGSSVTEVSEINFPNSLIVAAIASVTVFGVTTYGSHLKRSARSDLHKEVEELKSDAEMVSSTLVIAKQLMEQQVKYVEKLLNPDGDELSQSFVEPPSDMLTTSLLQSQQFGLAPDSGQDSKLKKLEEGLYYQEEDPEEVEMSASVNSSLIRSSVFNPLKGSGLSKLTTPLLDPSDPGPSSP